MFLGYFFNILSLFLWDLEHHDHIVWQGKNRELSGDQTGCRQANTYGKIIYHFGTKTESEQNVSKKVKRWEEPEGWYVNWEGPLKLTFWTFTLFFKFEIRLFRGLFKTAMTVRPLVLIAHCLSSLLQISATYWVLLLIGIINKTTKIKSRL